MERTALALVDLVAALLFLLAPNLVTAGPASPNVVLVVLDDLDETTSPYWEALPNTLEAIAGRGLTFTNAFAPTPICGPARASILTGQLGHNTGVLTNSRPQGGFEAFLAQGGEERSFPVLLEKAGYRTMLVGKYLNGYETEPEHIPPGWTEWYGATDNLFYRGYGYSLNENGLKVRYGYWPEDYATDVAAAKTIDFIERSAAGQRPFFAFVAPSAPHLPMPPAPRHRANPWEYASVPASPNFYELDLADKPSWLQLSGGVRYRSQDRNTADYRKRMGSLLAVDDMVADIVDALKRTGQLENTYILVTSDNGYNLGAHRLVHKMAPYEESLRIPLIVTGPGIAKGTDERMVLLTDLAPTILDLAGLDVPGYVDGRSLVPILRGTDPGPWRREFFAQYGAGGALNGFGSNWPPAVYYWLVAIFLGQDVPAYQALRTEDYLYVEWFEQELGGKHEYELYDLAVDRYQLENLLATPEGKEANAALVADLAARMEKLASCAGISCRE